MSRFPTLPLLLGGAFAIAVAVSFILAEIIKGDSRDASAKPAPPAITQAQYEDAVLSVVECLKSEGFDVKTLPAKGKRVTKFTPSIPDSDGVPDQETTKRLQSKMEACQGDLPEIELRFRGQRIPDEAKVHAMAGRIRSCISNGGPKPPFDPRGFSIPTTSYKGVADIVVEPGKELLYQQCALEEEAFSGFITPLATTK